jgi:outer membrane receptor for ferrienterochelin and colicins
LALNVDARRDGFTLATGYALTGRYNPLAQNKFLYSPEFRVNSTYSIPRIHIDLSVFYKYTGATQGFAIDANEQVIQTRIASYNTMDVTASKSFWQRRITCVLGVKNIFDITNINYSGGSGGVHSGGGSSLPVNMGRTYFVNLRFNLIQMQ